MFYQSWGLQGRLKGVFRVLRGRLESNFRGDFSREFQGYFFFKTQSVFQENSGEF